LLIAVALLLSWVWPALPLWGSFGIVGGVFLAVAVCLLAVTGQRLTTLKPEKTIKTVEENVRWMTNK
jgi:hypothetical protein